MTHIQQAHVQSFRVTDNTVWRHLTLTDSDGVVGVGEYTISHPGEDLDARASAAAQTLIGRAVNQITGPSLAAEWGDDFVAWTIASAADQAAGDLRAMAAAQPLAKLLNPSAILGPVKLYANINRRTEPRSPADFAAGARAALAAGHTAVKLAPFDGVTPQICGTDAGEPLIDAGLECIRAVKDVVGYRAQVMVDCHWRFTATRAAVLIDTLADIGVVWFECPIAETLDTIGQLCALRARCAAHGMRLAGCETMTGAAGFEPFIAAGAYDVVMPDVKHAGGLQEVLRVCRDAAAHGIACSLHNPTGPVAHLHSIHLCAAFGATERLEIQFGETPWFMELTDPPPGIEGDCALLSTAPGIGLRHAVPRADLPD